MRLLCVLLLVVVAVTIVQAGCNSAHDQYRQMTWRNTLEADGIGIQDDVDAYLCQERPTHLSQWYFP